ncbi:hypothetical protein Dimus_018135 [Dionaea muscipula]
MDDDRLTKGEKPVPRGLNFHGLHGLKPEERMLGQKFMVDGDAWLNLCKAGVSDNLSDTIAVATFPRTFNVRVKVTKPHVAVQGQLDYLRDDKLRSQNIDAQSGEYLRCSILNGFEHFNQI